jgi:hypothetical protein
MVTTGPLMTAALALVCVFAFKAAAVPPATAISTAVAPAERVNAVFCFIVSSPVQSFYLSVCAKLYKHAVKIWLGWKRIFLTKLQPLLLGIGYWVSAAQVTQYPIPMLMLRLQEGLNTPEPVHG